MDRRVYFVCRRCRWWFRAAGKVPCPNCGSRDVQAKKDDTARPKREG